MVKCPERDPCLREPDPQALPDPGVAVPPMHEDDRIPGRDHEQYCSLSFRKRCGDRSHRSGKNPALHSSHSPQRPSHVTSGAAGSKLSCGRVERDPGICPAQRCFHRVMEWVFPVGPTPSHVCERMAPGLPYGRVPFPVVGGKLSLPLDSSGSDRNTLYHARRHATTAPVREIHGCSRRRTGGGLHRAPCLPPRIRGGSPASRRDLPIRGVDAPKSRSEKGDSCRSPREERTQSCSWRSHSSS